MRDSQATGTKLWSLVVRTCHHGVQRTHQALQDQMNVLLDHWGAATGMATARNVPREDYRVNNLDAILSVPLQVQDILGSGMAVTAILQVQQQATLSSSPLPAVSRVKRRDLKLARRNGMGMPSLQRLRFAQPNSKAPVVWAKHWASFQQVLQDHVELLQWHGIQVDVQQRILLQRHLHRHWQVVARKLHQSWQVVARELHLVEHQQQLQDMAHFLQQQFHKEIDQVYIFLHHQMVQHEYLLIPEPDFDITNLHEILSTSLEPLQDWSGTMMVLDIVWGAQHANDTSATLEDIKSLVEQESMVSLEEEPNDNLCWLNETNVATTQQQQQQPQQNGSTWQEPLSPSIVLWKPWLATITHENERHGSVQRTTFVVLVVLVVHASWWLVLRKPRIRQWMLLLLLDGSVIPQYPQQPQQPQQQPQSNTSLVSSLDEEEHEWTTPLTPQTESSNTSNDRNHHPADTVPSNGHHNNRDLEEKLQRREEECRGLEIKLREVAQELKRIQLEQPSLNSVKKETETRLVKFQQLNADLQELIQGKDLQLLNFSTQVQQLTKDLMARESQLSNLLSLYSDQKEQVEKLKEESTRANDNHQALLQQSAAKLEELQGQLQASNSRAQLLAEQLEEFANELAQRRQNESVLKQQLEAQTGRARELENTLLRRQYQADQKLQEQLQDQAKRCRELADELDQKMKMQNELQGQLNDQIKRARDLEDQLQQRSLFKSKIQEQLSTQVSRSRQLEEQLQQHSNEQRVLQHEFDAQIEECKGLEERLKQECEDNVDLRMKLDRLSLELEKCQQQNAALLASEADARAMAGMDVIALANDASTTSDELQNLHKEHMQLKANLLDQVEQCTFLHKQVDQHKNLQAKQQERNKILLKTNQTLTEMIDDRQQQCGELEKAVASLSQQLEKYQRRQGEEATKLEELRQLRREKQEVAQHLISSQTRQSHVEQETLSKMATDLQEQQHLVASLRDEMGRIKNDYSERMEQMQRQHKAQAVNGAARKNRGYPPPLQDTSALVGKDVIEALSFDPLLNTTAAETKKEGSQDPPGLNDMLSSEVSFLFGLPSTA
jgi:hypothetical protein